MNKLLKVNFVSVCEGHLYRVMGEDEELFVYDLWLEAESQGERFRHRHVFKGFVKVEAPEECGGGAFNYPNYDAKRQAEELCEKVKKAGYFDPKHWDYLGTNEELEEASLNYLREAWAA